ncbi:hypothetical protein AYK26_05025 [Euryarchaeota archaeon SM23-78]|nr:MAG: hypothetical protein AYK26_05025 [Euryarchaeota archaeon SM23-78]
MSITRRDFIKLGLEGLVLLSTGCFSKRAFYQTRQLPEFLSDKYRRKPEKIDVNLARYLWHASQDGKEHAGLGLTSTGVVLVTTEEAKYGKVVIDDNLTKRIIQESPEVWENPEVDRMHSHPAFFETYINHELPFSNYIQNLFKKEPLKVLEIFNNLRALNPDLVMRRTLVEMPSASEYEEDEGLDNSEKKIKKDKGDIAIGLGYQEFMYQNYPKGKLRNKIAVIYKDLPPRVIHYGLTPEYEEKHRELVLNYYAKKRFNTLLDKNIMAMPREALEEASQICVEAGKKLDNFVENLLEEYTNIWLEYSYNHCDPWSTGECKEPSFVELASLINETGKFFIHDLGFVDIGW